MWMPRAPGVWPHGSRVRQPLRLAIEAPTVAQKETYLRERDEPLTMSEGMPVSAQQIDQGDELVSMMEKNVR